MQNKLILALSTLALTGLLLYKMAQPSNDSILRNQFLYFKIRFNKSYGSASELEYRFSVFKSTLDRIEKNNSDPQKTHTARVNKFSDLTFAEFKARFLTNLNRSANASFVDNFEAGVSPKKMDWRTKKGAVGKVKNQGACGSCWAFSTVASLETRVWQSTKKSVSLSEQELVDCAKGEYGNYGCNGGLQDEAFKYIIDNQIGTEKAYPYRGRDQKCSKKNKKKGERVSVESFDYVKEGVTALTKAAAKNVVSVSIEVQDDFMDYASGVYTNDESCGDQLNHAVTLVGYNTAVKKAYYIVRNSWGADWGIDGYVKMAIGTGDGTCGIANDSNVVPQV